MTKNIEMMLTAVYTPEAELEGAAPQFKTYTRREAADEAADFVRECILKGVPRNCVCSLIMGSKKSEDQS